MGASRLQCLLLVGLILTTNALADTSKAYRWSVPGGTGPTGTGKAGAGAIVAQPSSLKSVQPLAGATEIARLRLQNDGDVTVAWADNTLDGPIEVRLRVARGTIISDPPLPARATVGPRGSVVVALLDASSSTELWLDALPGDPSAKPLVFDYLVPLRQDTIQVDQGYGGSFSHTDPENRYAVDFATAIGTPIRAARDGVVMQVEADFNRAGLTLEKFGGRSNFIRILHEDGSMALYAHLKPEGVQVRIGQRVRAGQQIGLSGNTGFTTGPHLHFAVQVNRGMRLESLPFTMSGPAGPLRLAEYDD